MRSITLFVRLAICGLWALLAGSAVAEDIYTEFLSKKAVSGYDTVAFFTEGKPVKGKKEYSVEYLGVVWYFSSEENRARFQADPDHYRPQYGGYCAWAVAAKNSKAPGDAKYWKIVDDKLYLNYDRSVQQKWLQDIPGFIATANKNWPDLGGK